MRCILLILDGLGDRGHAAHEGQTPLQMASTPNLDRLAALGMTGLYHSWLLGTALPSELAHYLLFGYDLSDFPGRGYLEALGADIPVAKGEVALLANLVAVQEKGGLLLLKDEDPKAGREDYQELGKVIQSFHHEGINLAFHPTGGSRGVLLLQGEVSADITDSHPMARERPLMEVLPWGNSQEDEKARRTARVVNAYLRGAHQKLITHPLYRQRKRAGLPPVNAVCTHRPGQKQAVLSFSDKWGFKALAIASGILFKGLSLHLGMEPKTVKDTARPEVDLLERLKLAHQAREYDFVYIHTKAPDEAAHTKDPLIKKTAIEALDGALAFALEKIVTDPDTLLVVTSDHATNSAGAMIHSGEAVPLLMAGKYTWRDQVVRFDEVSCSMGSLGQVRGKELMYLILNFLDRGKLMGLRDSPRDQPYFPGEFKPLTVK
jgi:2,3-bisphosphoglycerate-independent phosphoglycerate mutase